VYDQAFVTPTNVFGSYVGNPVVEVLCIPNLISPPNGATINDPKPGLQWGKNDEQRSVTYTPLLEDTANPGVPIELVSLSSVSAEPLNDLSDGNYNWDVTVDLDPSYSPGYPFTTSPVTSSQFTFDVSLIQVPTSRTNQASFHLTFYHTEVDNHHVLSSCGHIPLYGHLQPCQKSKT